MKDQNLMTMEHISFRNGGPSIRQSFKLGELLEDRELQSNTTLIGVVADS